jgi:hypothetical protein
MRQRERNLYERRLGELINPQVEMLVAGLPKSVVGGFTEAELKLTREAIKAQVLHEHVLHLMHELGGRQKHA